MVIPELNLKNKTIIATVVVFAMTCFLGYRMIHKTNLEKADKLKVKISEAKKIKVMMEDTKAVEDKISALMVICNENAEPSTFLSKIVDIAGSCEIKTESINAGGVVSDGAYKFLPCSITFVSDYQKLRKFLNKLEIDVKYIKIDSLSVNQQMKSLEAAPKKAGEGAPVTVKIDVSGLYIQ